MSVSVKILPNQSLLDIAIQYYGTVTAIVAIALANNLSVTDDLAIGSTLLLPASDTNIDVVNYYANNNIQPATAAIDESLLDLITYAEVPPEAFVFDEPFTEFFT